MATQTWVNIGSGNACCLMAPSHYLNQCWRIISEVLWHLPENNFTGNVQDTYHWYESEKLLIQDFRFQWVNGLLFIPMRTFPNDPSFNLNSLRILICHFYENTLEIIDYVCRHHGLWRDELTVHCQCIEAWISLKFVSNAPINYKSALVWVMAGCWTSIEPLDDLMTTQFTAELGLHVTSSSHESEWHHMSFMTSQVTSRLAVCSTASPDRQYKRVMGNPLITPDDGSINVEHVSMPWHDHWFASCVVQSSGASEWALQIRQTLLYVFPGDLIARFLGPTWGPSGADRTQVGPMLAPWTMLSGRLFQWHLSWLVRCLFFIKILFFCEMINLWKLVC